MKLLFESWRKFSSLKENQNSQYFEKAIRNSDTYGDFNWKIDDFNIKFLGNLTLDKVDEMVSFGEWFQGEPKELSQLSPEERIQNSSFFGDLAKRQKYRFYLKHPEKRPPVILVTAPDSNNDSLYTRIGYGKGLINLNTLLGIKDVDVFHLKYTGKVLGHDKQRGLPGPAGRLY